jgi:hypothetical protein
MVKAFYTRKYEEKKLSSDAFRMTMSGDGDISKYEFVKIKRDRASAFFKSTDDIYNLKKVEYSIYVKEYKKGHIIIPFGVNLPYFKEKHFTAVEGKNIDVVEDFINYTLGENIVNDDNDIKYTTEDFNNMLLDIGK